MVTEYGDVRYPPQGSPGGDHDISSRRRIPHHLRLDPLRINPPSPRPSTADGLHPPHSHYPSPLPRSPRKLPAYPPRLDSTSRSASPRMWPEDGSPIQRPTYHTPTSPRAPHDLALRSPPVDGEFKRLHRQMSPPDQTDLPIPMSVSRLNNMRPKGYRPQERHPITPSHHGLALPRSAYNSRPSDPHAEDVLRSSMNSAMTSRSSIEQASGTERSSVLTKSSSITDLSPDTPDAPYEKDGGMSVEDAISMYLDGFSDVTEEPASPDLLDDVKLNPLTSHPPVEFMLDSSHPSGDELSELNPIDDLPLSPTLPDLNPPDQNLLDEQFLGDTQPEQKPLDESAEPNSSAQIPSTPRIEEAKVMLPGIVPPPLLIDTESRDCYGFRKATTYVTLQQYETWNSSYLGFAANRRVKWAELLGEYGLPTIGPTSFPPKSSKVKRYVRKGIPPELRGGAWFWYAGGYEHLNRNPGLYDQLVKQAMESPSNDDKEHIERDLHRTFPDNLHFKPDPTGQLGNLGASSGSSDPGQGSVIVETEMIRALRRVLYAFAIHNPQIGYTQSLNFITGMLLLFLTEEKAFWMLHIITSVYLPSTHEISLEGANIDLWILMVLLKDSLPNVYNKIAGSGAGKSRTPPLSVHSRLPDITLGLTNWLMSVFIGTLPLETTLRVWDVFFYEGSKTFFRVSMAIFKACEKDILAVSDPMEVFQVVQTVPKKLLDANALLDDSFIRRNRFGQGRIEELRASRRTAVRQEKLRRSQALSKGHLQAATDEWPTRSRTPIPGIERSFADSWRQMRHHAFR